MMRRISGYKKFLEDLAISANDTPVAKMAKQAVNSDSDYLKDYKAKKDTITQLFLATNPDGQFKYDDATLKTELEKYLGKEEQGDEEDRNDLLQELTIVLDLQRQLMTIEKQNLSDKKRMDEAADEAADEQGPRKDELNKRVEETKSKVTENTGKIADLQRRITDSKKAFDEKIADFIKDVEKSTDEIKKTPPK